VIVPREASFGLDSSEYWKQVARAKWERYPWPDIKDQNGRRGNALLGRLEIELAPDTAISKLAAEGLAREGLLEEADKFAARIRQLLSNKPRALSCAVRFLQWPKEKLHLVYFDPRRRTRRTEPLPVY